MKKSKKQESYTYKQICNILCQGCRLKIPLNTHIFNDNSYRIYHIIMEKDITCDASDWMKAIKKDPKKRRKEDK